VPGAEGMATAYVEQPWIPEQTWKYQLSVRAAPKGGYEGTRRRIGSQTVTVVKRSRHFHHQSLHPSLEYTTEGMVNDASQLDYRADRGVIAQQWRGRVSAYNRWRNTTQALAECWVAPFRQGWSGVVIDEFLMRNPG